jgi:proteic killer suppression protein
MIRSFRSKALAELWSTGRSSKVSAALHKRLLVRLDRLDAARNLSELNVPGFDFHPLKGFDPVRCTIHINGPWCITFEFRAGDIYRLDLEQYH